MPNILVSRLSRGRKETQQGKEMKMERRVSPSKKGYRVMKNGLCKEWGEENYASNWASNKILRKNRLIEGERARPTGVGLTCIPTLRLTCKPSYDWK